MRVAFETNRANRPFHSFANRVNHARSSAPLINGLDPKLHTDVVEPTCFINIDNFLAAFLQLLLVHHRVDSYPDLFADSSRFDSLSPSDFDLAHRGTRLHRHDHLHPVAFRLGKDANI